MKNMSEGRAAKRALTVYVGGRKIKGECINWESVTGETRTLPTGFYDVVAVREGQILLAWNLGEGTQYQPSKKHRYAIKNTRQNQNTLRQGIDKVVRAIVNA